jgi:hypothetical protein
MPEIRNNKTYDFSSVELLIDGDPIPVDAEVEYSIPEVQEEYLYKRGKPIARTPGQVEPVEVTIRLPKDIYDQMVNNWGNGFQDKEIDVQVVYADKDGVTTVDYIRALRLTGGGSVNVSKGAEPVMVELKGKALEVWPQSKVPYRP